MEELGYWQGASSRISPQENGTGTRLGWEVVRDEFSG